MQKRGVLKGWGIWLSVPASPVVQPYEDPVVPVVGFWNLQFPHSTAGAGTGPLCIPSATVVLPSPVLPQLWLLTQIQEPLTSQA
jgi:hypothetical protein